MASVIKGSCSQGLFTFIRVHLCIQFYLFQLYFFQQVWYHYKWKDNCIHPSDYYKNGSQSICGTKPYNTVYRAHRMTMADPLQLHEKMWNIKRQTNESCCKKYGSWGPLMDAQDWIISKRRYLNKGRCTVSPINLLKTGEDA